MILLDTEHHTREVDDFILSTGMDPDFPVLIING